MKKLENALLIMLVISILAKTLPVTGSGPALTFIALILSVVYFFFGFVIFTKIRFREILKTETYKHLKPWDIIISIVTGVVFQTVVLGLIFKLQYWPGAHYMSRAGLIMLFIIIIVAVIMLKTVNSFIYIGILKRGITFFLLLLLLHLLPLTTRLNIFKEHPEIEAQILLEADSRL